MTRPVPAGHARPIARQEEGRGRDEQDFRAQQFDPGRLAVVHQRADDIGRHYFVEIAEFEMAPWRLVRRALKDAAVPVERLAEAGLPEARRACGTIL